MIALLPLTLLGAVLHCPAGASVHREVSGTTEWLICETPQGVREGPMLFVTDGHVASRTHYRGGKKDGEDISTYRNGVVGNIARWRADALHGLQERFIESGRKTFEQEMRDGKAHGTLRRWRDDGTLLVESEWRDDQPVRFTTFHPNGSVRATAERGLPDTVVVERDVSGAIIKTTRFVNGMIDDGTEPDRVDAGSLSCPKETFARVGDVGFTYNADRCGGYPHAVGGRMVGYAWGPRSALGALAELGCTFHATSTAEDVGRMQASSWLHSLASVGE